MSLKTGLYGRKALEVVLVIIDFVRTSRLACFQVDDEMNVQEVKINFSYEARGVLDMAVAEIGYNNEVAIELRGDAVLTKEMLAKLFRQVYLSLRFFRPNVKLMFEEVSEVMPLAAKTKSGRELHSKLVSRLMKSISCVQHILSFSDEERLFTKEDLGIFADMLDYDKSNMEECADPLTQEMRRVVYHRLVQLYSMLNKAEFSEHWNIVEMAGDAEWLSIMKADDRETEFKKITKMLLSKVYNADDELINEVDREAGIILSSNEFKEFCDLLNVVREDDWLMLHLFNVRFDEFI